MLLFVEDKQTGKTIHATWYLISLFNLSERSINKQKKSIFKKFEFFCNFFHASGVNLSKKKCSGTNF